MVIICRYQNTFVYLQSILKRYYYGFDTFNRSDCADYPRNSYLHAQKESRLRKRKEKPLYEVSLFLFVLLISSNPAFHLVDISVNCGNSHNVDDITDRRAKINEVDGLVQSHLNRTNNLNVRIEHL